MERRVALPDRATHKISMGGNWVNGHKLGGILIVGVV